MLLERATMKQLYSALSDLVSSESFTERINLHLSEATSHANSRISLKFSSMNDMWQFILFMGQQDDEIMETSPTSIELSAHDASVTLCWEGRRRSY